VKRAPARAGFLSAAARVESAAGRAARLLDRVDEAVLPAAHACCQHAERVGARSKAFAARVGARVATRLGHDATGPDDDAPPASGQAGQATTAPAGSRYGGMLARGARLGVVAAVGAIVVSAAAATFQGPGHFGPSSSPPGDPAEVGRLGDGRPPAQTVAVGPYPADDVASYLAYAGSRLAELTSAAPEADLFAVVSFAGYRTPAQLVDLLSTYRVHRVFLRLPPEGDVLQAPVRDPVADVDAAFERAAAVEARRAGASSGGTGSGPASAFRRRCACLFAAVVRAPAGRLAELSGVAGVRVVDAAPPGSTLTAATFVPLLPERR
jgi:hypothetical protein